jgi:predicted membrane protein
MDSKTFFALLIWAICLILVLEVGFEALTMGDTFANIFGIVIIAAFGFVSYTTNCFTNINFKKK